VKSDYALSFAILVSQNPNLNIKNAIMEKGVMQSVQRAIKLIHVRAMET
jgi:hypothetical protein